MVVEPAGIDRTEQPIFAAEPITPNFGALVKGVDLGEDLAPETLNLIRSAIDRSLVLVFEGQSLSPTELRDFVANFGPLFRHHDDEGVIFADDLPEVLEMRKEPDGKRLFGGGDWHADVTFVKPAGYISALQSVILPPVGGDTAFADTTAAFASLSSGLQELLRGLDAVHSYDGPGRATREGLFALHPVVRRHSETGAEGIYLNRMFTKHFDGMTEEESRPLIDYLDRHMSRPEFSFRHRWRPGNLVMWDNRFTLHYPINDFEFQRRLLIRCTALES